MAGAGPSIDPGGQALPEAQLPALEALAAGPALTVDAGRPRARSSPTNGGVLAPGFAPCALGAVDPVVVKGLCTFPAPEILGFSVLLG